MKPNYSKNEKKMINRQIKLKLNKKQENKINEWFSICTGIYNFGIRKIELNANDNIYFSKFKFQNLLSDHSKKLEIPSHTIQGILLQSFNAWERCFKQISKKPKLKGVNNKLKSIPFIDPIKNPIGNTISLPKLGKIKFYKQDLPIGNIKRAVILKKASGYYLQLSIDTKYTFQVNETNNVVGIDTGFKNLLTLSDGIVFENKRFYKNSEKRIKQAQKGKNKKLVQRLHERIANRRNNYNHKISRKIVENYKEIYITNDNLVLQSKILGKSVGDSAISEIRKLIIYKGDNHGRKVILVNSKNTTKTCSKCNSLTGPTGLKDLNVRNWECKVCRTNHERDINAASVILNFGLGYNLVNLKSLGEI